MRDAPPPRYRKTVRPFNGSFGKNSGVVPRVGERCRMGRRDCACGLEQTRNTCDPPRACSAHSLAGGGNESGRGKLGPPRFSVAGSCGRSCPSGLCATTTDGRKSRPSGPAHECHGADSRPFPTSVTNKIWSSARLRTRAHLLRARELEHSRQRTCVLRSSNSAVSSTPRSK